MKSQRIVGSKFKIQKVHRPLIQFKIYLHNFKKYTTTLSLKQDMFRSFNDRLQLWIRLRVRWINAGGGV